MQVVTPELIADRIVLLRLDIDVPLRQTQDKSVAVEDFRLNAELPTLKLCLDYAKEVIIIGHIGRPGGREVKELSVAPIYDWLEEQGFADELKSGKLKLLENLRFEVGESFDTAQDKGEVLEYAKELAKLGDVFVNEAFAAHHPAASTTVLPTLLPHAAGLRFAQEVEILTKIREASRKPLVVIIGGAKIEDKLPAVEAMAKIADHVLVGGKVAREISQGDPLLDSKGSPYTKNPYANVLVGRLNEEGTDVTEETLSDWKEIISQAKMIVWNGPLGKIEDPKNDQTKRLADIIISSEAETIVGGGDTVGYLESLGLLGRFGFSASDSEREDAKADKPSRFISTGGGAMLKFLAEGTLPTLESLG